MSTDTPRAAASSAESVPETLTPDPDAGVMREVQARRVRLRRILALAMVASTIVLGAIGWWTHHEVELSMRATRGAALKSVLYSQAESLRVWIDDQELSVRRLARDRQLRERAGTAARNAAAASANYCSSPQARRLVAQLDESLAGAGTVAFNVVISSGQIVASNFTEYCDLRDRVEAFERDLAPASAGEALFVPPH